MVKLELLKAPEQLKKLWTLSKKALATIATTSSLLFSACSNNTSSTRQQHEQKRQEQENIKKEMAKKDNTIDIEKLDIATIVGEHDYLVDRRETNVDRLNKLVDEYNNLVDTHPEKTQEAANLARSLDMLHDEIVETEKKIDKLENRLNKTHKKLRNDTQKSKWLKARYEESLKIGSNGHYQHMEKNVYKKKGS